ncbi:MAG: archease [Acidobacteria bacterium]|nr:archease [Acidobacteriota bacterium]
MIRGPAPYETFEHTADAGVIVRAPELPELFERAAAAMFDTMFDLARVEPGPEPVAVEVRAADVEELLVEWLGELLSLAMARREVLAAFEVRELDETHVAGRAWGEPIDAGRHGFRTEIKGVTYHHLRVAGEDGGWMARVLFDL